MVQLNTALITDYKDWPNTAGFNAIEDHRTEAEIAVTGNIPSYASGKLYRTGPGGYTVPHDGKEISADHWFDGFTVVHRFNIAGSDSGPAKVTYHSYGQVDKLIEHIRKTGHHEGMSFANKRDPCDGLFKKIKSVFAPVSFPDPAHTQNIGVVFRPTLPAEINSTAADTDIEKRKLLTVVTDAANAKHFDANTLEPLGVTNQKVLHPELIGPLSGAHAEHDPVTGDVYNYNLNLGASATYKIFRASSSTGEVDILATLSGAGIEGAYLHSLFMTENFVILCVWPATYKMHGASILLNQNIMDSIKPFDPTSKTKWYVVDRRSGRGLVKTFEGDPFFCFHTVNAWEETDDDGKIDIVCDLVQYADSRILHKFYYTNMVSNGPGVEDFDKQHGLCGAGYGRWRLTDVPMKGTEKQIAFTERELFIEAPRAGELPRINPRHNTKPHRYVWSVITTFKSSFVDGLSKLDTRTGESLTWQHNKHTPGEPIFVPRPGATSEDDGVVLSVVLDGERGTSYLLCLDAATMKETGRADVGYPVGFGFHGTFISEE